MKTKAMAHQTDALRKADGRRGFAYLMEMGTGKTWTVLAEAERLYAAGKITGLLVVAPKGVHTNWIAREIPEHVEVPVLSWAYSSSETKAAKAGRARLFAPRLVGEPGPLRILAINIDALLTVKGYDLAFNFLNVTRAMMVVDESDRIKTAGSQRTKRVLALGQRADYRRICSGMPLTNSPIDMFAQMEFLESGLLGTTSLRAFTAEYAELMPPESGLMRNIQQRLTQKFGREQARNMAPQVVARDALTGEPKWRNLDKLQRLIAPHAFRVMKSECLDLPPKVYTQLFFTLPTAMRRAYDLLESECRIVFDDEPPTVVAALGALVKLQQITSGFVMVDGETRLIAAGENPRMAALMDAIESIDGQFIIWARFTEELIQIAAALAEAGITHAVYRGKTRDSAREDAVDGFQSGRYRAFVGQPQSGGIGLTLTAANTVIYYSNDFNMGTRVQSEDRAHRKGTTRTVVYMDIVAESTIDQPIARTLQRKLRLAHEVLADRGFRVPLQVDEN
jgi:SNF2 family DNA or RNA helicase